MKILLVLILSLCPFYAVAQPKLVSQKISLKSGKSVTLDVAEGFDIVPAAEGLKRVRFFAKAPDGRIFVTDMYNLTDNKRGAVYILDGWDPQTGRFAKVIPYLTGLRNPNSVQFYRDGDGQNWLYLAETDKVTRRKFTLGEIKPTDNNAHVLATFPDYGLSYKYGGWHLTRTIAFGPNGKLYISVGSSCNSCVEKEKVRASVVEMNPDGSDQRQFVSGLRNAVSLKWIGNFLWASNQGSDHLGLQKPDETFYTLKDGADYGWPYCHSSNGRIFADPKLKRSSGCAGVVAPYAFFPAHSSALGFDYFDDSNSADQIKNAFLVSLHGSTNKAIGHGYKIVLMRKGERLQDFIAGFLRAGKVVGRPCDIMKLDANSFLFTDDHTGIVYYVRKKGWTTNLAAGSTGAENPQNGTPQTSPEKSPDNKSCLSMAVILVGTLFLAVR